MQNISTGYTPEFALGAVYQGENAANADWSNQLELVKNFLANQREVQMQPLDVRIKDAEASRADAQKTPEMLDAYKRGYIGQMDSQAAAGDTARVLAPFKQRAEQAELENNAKKQHLLYTLMDTDTKLRDNGSIDESGNMVNLSPQDRTVLSQFRQQLVQDMASTPEHLQKTQLQDEKLAMQEKLARLKMENNIELAKLKSKLTTSKDPKTAEEVIARLQWKISQGELLSPADQEAYSLATSVISAKVPVAPSGVTLNPAVGGTTKTGEPVLQSKPERPAIVQPGSTGRGAPPKKLSPEERQALIDKITKGN